MEIKLQELLSLVKNENENPFFKMTGKYVFIRTVTYHYTGQIEEVIGDFIKLSTAAWIAYSGRFHDALKNENFSEVEPFIRDILLNINSIIDCTEIISLQREQK